MTRKLLKTIGKTVIHLPFFLWRTKAPIGGLCASEFAHPRIQRQQKGKTMTKDEKTEMMVIHPGHGLPFASNTERTRLVPMPGRLTPAQMMLNAAVDAGFEILVSYDDEVDYCGKNPVKAWQAIVDTDTPDVFLVKDDTRMDWALIIPGNGTDDLSDYWAGKWIDAWWDMKDREGAWA